MLPDPIRDVSSGLVWDTGGFTRPSGSLERSKGRVVFVPDALPPSAFYDAETVTLFAAAERKIGELREMGNWLADPRVLARICLKREAVMSSKIEGTMASLDDLNRHEAIGDIGRIDAENLRLSEVVNYVRASEWMLKQARQHDRQMDLDLVRTAHGMLLEGVRCQDKTPGEFRRQQNFVVKTRIRQEIVYTPPPPERLPVLLKNLVAFMQEDHENMPELVQCAIMHYQFEAIHPFGDGNGRVGRLLLPVFLSKKGMLSEPFMSLSAYFEGHREEYYAGLLEVSRKSRWREWLAFFFRAFIDQADEAIRGIKKLVEMRTKYREMLEEGGPGGNAIRLTESLFVNPYITISRAADFLHVTYPTAKRAVMVLAEAGILTETNIRRPSRVFLAKEINSALHE